MPCAKLDALVEQLGDVIGGGHRALVFSQFTGFLAKVRERLDAEGIGYCYLDGGTRRRDRVLERFKDGDDPVFLISLKAGGFGLNLTEADYCFLLDPWWNPATEAQAIDRTHRIGQTRPVMVYRMIARDTIEEKVVALARRKAALFRGVMDDGDLFASSITAEDIRGMVIGMGGGGGGGGMATRSRAKRGGGGWLRGGGGGAGLAAWGGEKGGALFRRGGAGGAGGGGVQRWSAGGPGGGGDAWADEQRRAATSNGFCLPLRCRTTTPYRLARVARPHSR